MLDGRGKSVLSQKKNGNIAERVNEKHKNSR
jgi:hypothetical protein